MFTEKRIEQWKLTKKGEEMSIYLIQNVYIDYEQGYTRNRADLTSYGYFDNKELAQRKADQLNIEFYNDLNYFHSGNRKDETFNKFKKRKKKQGDAEILFT